MLTKLRSFLDTLQKTGTIFVFYRGNAAMGISADQLNDNRGIPDFTRAQRAADDFC